MERLKAEYIRRYPQLAERSELDELCACHEKIDYYRQLILQGDHQHETKEALYLWTNKYHDLRERLGL